MISEPSWWKYVEFYPDEDEEGYDGEHMGGIKGISDDAPEEAKEEFKALMEAEADGMRVF